MEARGGSSGKMVMVGILLQRKGLPLWALYSPGRLPAGMWVVWVNPEWVHLSGSGRGKLLVGTYTSLDPMLMDRCDDPRHKTRPKFLTLLVDPAGRRRGVNCLHLVGNPAYSILAAAAVAMAAVSLIALGSTLGLFARVGMGRPTDLGEGGNSLGLSPRFGPKLLRHLSCPSSLTTPLKSGESVGAQGLDWLLLCALPTPPHPTPPHPQPHCVFITCHGKGHGRQSLHGEDEPGSWSK